MLRSLLPPEVVAFETAACVDLDRIYPAEAACVERAVESRRREFAAGRMCARLALAKLGVEEFPVLPDADRAPRWPAETVGSISHCAGLACAAVARRETSLGLGIDVELAEPLSDRLAKRICTPSEDDELRCLPRREGLDWYKLVFSAKESVYKALYPLARTSLEFHDVEVEIDPDAGTFVARLTRSALPTLAGWVAFRGRFASSNTHVYTAVVLPSERQYA